MGAAGGLRGGVGGGIGGLRSSFGVRVGFGIPLNFGVSPQVLCLRGGLHGGAVGGV